MMSFRSAVLFRSFIVNSSALCTMSLTSQWGLALFGRHAGIPSSRCRSVYLMRRAVCIYTWTREVRPFCPHHPPPAAHRSWTVDHTEHESSADDVDRRQSQLESFGRFIDAPASRQACQRAALHAAFLFLGRAIELQTARS